MVALEDGATSASTLQEMESICEAVHIIPHSRTRAATNCLLSLPTPTPLWAAYCQSPNMAQELHTLSSSGKFDVAHVEHLRAAHFSENLSGLPRLLDAVDCITALRRQILDQGAKGFSKLLSWEEWSKLRSYEPRVYRNFGHITVTSPHDASALTALDPKGLPPIEVIANGVDLEYFSPQKIQAEADCLVFSGKMSYIANEDAARFLLDDILPRLRQQIPNAHLILAGSKPSSALVARANQIGGVTVTGYVEDLRPHILRASVAVCPMRIGVGIQNKALEAMALGRPVVATPLVARSFRAAALCGAMQLAETPEEIAQACATLMVHPKRAKESGEAARTYVEQYHRWEVVAESFTALYHRVSHDAVRC
jgi:glycosyltransferase involved in cell wall biosynthesis